MINQDKEITYTESYQLHDQIILKDKELQHAIACLLLDLTEEGDNDANAVEELQLFNSEKVPTISIYDYIGRIVKQAQCSQECLIMALILCDRLSQKHGRIIVKSINIHRLYVASVLLSAKFYDDRFFQNLYYAKVAGISHDEFNQLERTLLVILDFRLLIDPEIFFMYRERLILHYHEAQE